MDKIPFPILRSLLFDDDLIIVDEVLRLQQDSRVKTALQYNELLDPETEQPSEFRRYYALRGEWSLDAVSPSVVRVIFSFYDFCQTSSMTMERFDEPTIVYLSVLVRNAFEIVRSGWFLTVRNVFYLGNLIFARVCV